MARPHDLGRGGEAVAASFLERHGWRILERNYRLGHAEIDLIVRRGRVVAFVEVKTRSGTGFGHPLASVTPLKQREIERVARSWIQRRGGEGDSYRFDAVAIHWRRGAAPRVEHVADAWRL